jgi:hypothetical protein
MFGECRKEQNNLRKFSAVFLKEAFQGDGINFSQ